VVKKELSGVSVTETFQRSRVRGKTTPPKLIPTQDVLAVLQAATNATAASSFAETERRISEQRRSKEREERRMQMRVRTHIDTAIAARARKKRKEELKKAAEARAQEQTRADAERLARIREERARADAERRARIRDEHRAAVRDAMRLDREDEPRGGVPGWRMRRVR
jgi:hypothetical protein